MNVPWLTEATKGNAEAERFLANVWTIFSQWDDLIDKDKPITDEGINTSFWFALVDLPSNSFYASNFSSIQPVLRTAIISWMTSNELAKGSELGRVLKSEYVNIVVTCALLIGGLQHAREISLKEWSEFYEEN